MTDTVKIFLKDCKVDLRVGIYAKEKEKPQPVVINVEAEAALTHRFDDVNDKGAGKIIDYAPLYDFISRTLTVQNHIPLLETVAEQIITFCFNDTRIQTVRVRLEKTQIFERANAGIEISRSRL